MPDAKCVSIVGSIDPIGIGHERHRPATLVAEDMSATRTETPDAVQTRRDAEPRSSAIGGREADTDKIYLKLFKLH